MIFTFWLHDVDSREAETLSIPADTPHEAMRKVEALAESRAKSRSTLIRVYVTDIPAPVHSTRDWRLPFAYWEEEQIQINLISPKFFQERNSDTQKGIQIA
ncbi:hypothetical protein ACFYKX_11225 [Cytobacillus sp. FJAT-54145]|uniref:Uncharacterized protein n=1 Tax=Cytobacillus spartinae TaxID=3299023 RepID=A0ABW6KAA7_9BACI